MKVWLAQLNPTVGDLDANAARIAGSIRTAREGGADLAVFPELAITGYPPLDLLEKRAFVRDNLLALERVASEAVGVEAVVGFVEPNETGNGNALFNAAAILRDGRVAQVVRKSLLPTYDVFDEDRHFEPAAERGVITVAGRPAGVTICEDVWSDPALYHRDLYTCEPVSELARGGATLLLNISASPYSLGRPAMRERLMQEHARRHGLPVICVNQVGGNDEILFDGTSVVVDARGMTRARLASFSEEERMVDLETLASLPSPASLPELSGRPAASLRAGSPGTDAATGAAPPVGLWSEALRALVMGTRDYVRKCGFGKVVIGLSGGIDSSLTAAIAVEALGAPNVTGIAMPSPYSSPESLEDARELAARLGIRFRTVPIDGIFARYLETLAPEFSGRAPDVTEENIQARIRGNILMALSNKFGCLVLTTGNKSELAVGYCTLYGDMSGGLAVISDVPKTMVYAISRQMNAEAGREIIPARVLEKVPSAELRPDQTDQDTLPPYGTLDGILRMYVEEGESVAEIVAAGFDPATVGEVVRLVDRNEYKRKQAAPGLRITSKAFGVGRRMPIAQRYRET